MHLVRLELNNYRRFEEAEVEFPDGVVGIIGVNGAGKSSLVEAIAWALYGNDLARSSKEEIRRLGASINEVCRVILDFEMNGDNYRVVRELKGASSTADAALFVNGRPQARGVTATSAMIDKTLGMDWKSFLVSFFARQRELNALTEYQPAKRIEVLSRLLGIERIETAVKKLRQDKRDSQTKLTTTQSFLADTNQLQQQLQVKQKEQLDLKSQMEEQELKLKIARSELTKFNQEFDLLKSKKDNFLRLQKEAEVKQSQLQLTEEQTAVLQNEKEEILELIPLQEELKPYLDGHSHLQSELVEQEKLKQKVATRKSLDEQIQAHRNLIEQDQKRLRELEAGLAQKSQLEKELGQALQKLAGLEEEVEGGQKQHNLFSAEEKSLLDQAKKLEQQLQKIEELGPDSVCDRCLRPLGKDFNYIRAHIQEELDKLRTSIKAVIPEKERQFQRIQKLKSERDQNQKQKESFQARLKQLEQSVQEINNLKQRISQSNTNLDNFRRAYQELGTQPYDSEVHQKLQAELQLAEKKKQEYLQISEKIKSLPQLERKLKEFSLRLTILQQESEKIKTSLNKLDFDSTDFHKKEMELEQRRQELHQAELGRKDLHYSELNLGAQIKQFEEKIKESQLLQKQIRELQEQSQYLERLDLLLVNFKVHLIGRIRPALSALTKSLLSEMTEGKYSEMELDDNYEIFIYDNGQKFGLERFSGGEKDLANLCLRLAISLLITQSAGTDFSFIVLDEIFGSQDQQRKENILRALGNLRNRFRQIILITHIDDIKDQVETLWQVIENPDGTSRVETSIPYD
ncbi:MAG: hypothetical protein A2142_00070 [candidate division Zixibacteria bacterium RBG_16_48_11]|nr:MAG: hypothetical protein A2142_00070 [candidate division Zixibacteria bacterium RBG_16_48_11]